MNVRKNERLCGRICPKCGITYHDVPAMSRTNGTLICPDCGVREALESIGVCTAEREEILKTIHRATHANCT